MNKLQAELKKRLPFARIEEEAVLNLARTSDQVQHRFEQLFRAHGLTGPQYNILRILRGEGEPLPILEVAGRMITVVPAITGIVDRLERAELVVRRRCEKDRRVVYVELTPAGAARLGEIDAPLEALHRAVMSGLSESEQRQLIGLLERIRETLPTN
jgi:DNA-binding MarR family transcriptional regulator